MTYGEEMRRAIVAVLRLHVTISGLSQSEIAERAGTSQSQVSRILGGHSSPGVEAVAGIAEAIGVGLLLVVEQAGAVQRKLSALPDEDPRIRIVRRSIEAEIIVHARTDDEGDASPRMIDPRIEAVTVYQLEGYDITDKRGLRWAVDGGGCLWLEDPTEETWRLYDPGLVDPLASTEDGPLFFVFRESADEYGPWFWLSETHRMQYDKTIHTIDEDEDETGDKSDASPGLISW